MRDLGYGRDYAYDHDVPDRFSGQDYFPDGMERRDFYRPTDQGAEAVLKERLDTFLRLRRERAQGG